MKFVVLGAGATGGLLGAHLARAGEEITLIARGPHLEAMRRNGLRVTGVTGDFTVHPECTDDLTPLGSADVVFIAVKAHSLPPLAERVGAALGRDTNVFSAQNGIPWWFFEHFGGPWEGTRLEAVDPGGVISQNISSTRVVGCIVYPAARIAESGLIEHLEGNRISLGELDGRPSARTEEVSAALTRAGFKAPVQPRIRPELWLKLLGNASFNPISALTGATLEEITSDEAGLALVRAVMAEVELIGRELGIEIPVGIEKRIQGAAKVGGHKTSMLQDVEAGRPLELGATVGALVELAGRIDLQVPHLRALYACANLLDQHLRPLPRPTPEAPVE
ncbi:MAG TPA: 2-dehydropantoate 2-reductase [Candidatus Dormibacteraeota bacterium]|nr:2-dehydropantoate 2-reductase [Candidatus Dormibacteraeota bacterium]HVC23705.1 2-dehydropantoate 2-reductase [Candidatus Dormibacteraeota bacterium]